MRDLVETVIGQVLQQDAKKRPVETAPAETFQSTLSRTMEQKEKPLIVQGQEIKNRELWNASLKFEGMLFQQMMEAMRKTVPESEVLPSGFAQGVQQSMFDQAVADSAGEQGSLGLAMSIYRQMEQSQAGQAKSVGSSAVRDAIQASQKASDSERMTTFTGLRGDIHGAH